MLKRVPGVAFAVAFILASAMPAASLADDAGDKGSVPTISDTPPVQSPLAHFAPQQPSATPPSTPAPTHQAPARVAPVIHAAPVVAPAPLVAIVHEASPRRVALRRPIYHPQPRPVVVVRERHAPVRRVSPHVAAKPVHIAPQVVVAKPVTIHNAPHTAAAHATPQHPAKIAVATNPIASHVQPAAIAKPIPFAIVVKPIAIVKPAPAVYHEPATGQSVSHVQTAKPATASQVAATTPVHAAVTPVVSSAPVAVATSPTPAAKPTSAPTPAGNLQLSAPPAATATPAPAPASSIDDLTRDGSDKTAPVVAGAPSPTSSIVRMIVSLIAVLILAGLAIKMFKKYPHLAKVAGMRDEETPVVASEEPKTFRPQAKTAPRSFADILAVKQPVTKPSSAPNLDSFKILGHGGLEIVGTQSLAGSGTVIYLVKAGDRMMLLGASQQGGVRTLAEWDSEETRTPEEQKESFDSYLRQQGVVVDTSSAADIELSAVRERLKSATRNLSQHVEEVQAPAKKRTGGIKS